MTSQQSLKAKLIACISLIDDPRLARRQLHKLCDIIAIALCSTIASCNTFVDMEIFANEKIDWLKEFLELPNGVPSHDTFGRVFEIIDQGQLRDCLQAWTREISQILQDHRYTVALDGKCLKSSGSKSDDQNPLWIVSAWASKAKLILGQVDVDSKSNEITALPALLELLDLKNALITADALNCQRSIAQKAIHQDGDYLLAVKGNQPKLHEAVQSVFDDVSIGQEHFDLFETSEKGHGREEVRECLTCSAPEVALIGEKLQWPGLNSVAMIISTRVVGGKKSQEVRYYISSLGKDSSAEMIARSIRSHWGVENSLHWVLDVSFQEDRCKVRQRNAAANLGALRRFAASLLQQEKTAKVGVAAKRLKAALNHHYIEKVLSAA